MLRVIAIIAIGAVGALGQNPEPTPVRVSVSVTGASLIQAPIKSELLRRLREFNDVVIVEDRVEDHAEYQVNVLASEVRLAASGSVGMAISVLVTIPIGDLLPAGMEDFKAFFRHYIFLGDDLPEVCGRIVARIDQEAIEPTRQLRRKGIDERIRLNQLLKH